MKESWSDSELKPIKREDIETVWKMQVDAFSDLLKKYQDYDTNPAAENIDGILTRFEQPWTSYYCVKWYKGWSDSSCTQRGWRQKTHFSNLDHDRVS